MRPFTLAFLLFAPPALAAPVHLRTNSLENPLGIDTPHPTFSWQSSATTPNWTQSAYEILVTTRPELLHPGKADIWDSGRIASPISVDRTYAGPALKPQQRYLWAVSVWDSHGIPTISPAASFETGLLFPVDWKAQWIMRPDPAAAAELAAVRWI